MISAHGLKRDFKKTVRQNRTSPKSHMARFAHRQNRTSPKSHIAKIAHHQNRTQYQIYDAQFSTLQILNLKCTKIEFCRAQNAPQSQIAARLARGIILYT